MAILIGLLTALLVLTCLFLGLLVLIQLPKKEAGMGSAFGGGMTDSILGAGSGNVLTAATRYAAGIFLILALGLSILKTREANAGKDKFNKELNAAAKALPAPAKPVVTNQVIGATNVALKPIAKPATPATPAAKTETPSFDATPTIPGATPTAPGEAFGATPTIPGATPTTPK
jgi:preprotein translocase subunit SecG